MLLAYLDESYTKDRYFIAALLVPDREARSLTDALDTVVREACYKHGNVVVDAELHGYDMVAGKGCWEPLAGMVRARIGVYNAAFKAIADHNVHIIIRSLDVVGLKKRYPAPDHPHSIVLTHVIERVDECAETHGEMAILIADEVDGQDNYRRDLWAYQRSSTWGYRARPIKQIVDTIHFAPSHSSRLLQAADLIAYLARRRATHTEQDERAARANEALWARIQPRIWHQWCWWPEPRRTKAPTEAGA